MEVLRLPSDRVDLILEPPPLSVFLEKAVHPQLLTVRRKRYVGVLSVPPRSHPVIPHQEVHPFFRVCSFLRFSFKVPRNVSTGVAQVQVQPDRADNAFKVRRCPSFVFLHHPIRHGEIALIPQEQPGFVAPKRARGFNGSVHF